MKKFTQIDLISFVLVILSFGSELCHAEEGGSQSGKIGGQSIFNVMDYGARGVSATVDTKAFSAAWVAACKVSGGVMLVPSGHTFRLLPVDFPGGNCQPNVVFQVDGNIAAPPRSEWNPRLTSRWICFNGTSKGLTIRGAGWLDGNGGTWWKKSPANSVGVNIVEQGLEGNTPHMLSVVYGTNVTISGITLKNSPRMHVFVFSSVQVEMYGLKVSSPGDSPNTDGIHVSNTQHVRIHHSNVSCGDDCVSIQTGCVDIRVYNMHCDPGHGYSIGGLGADAHVSDISVTDSTVSGADSLTGVRIKTRQGGSGNVRNVTFANIQVSQVGKSIVIDQHYNELDRDSVRPKSTNSDVSISGVTFENITGTYRNTSIVLDCSDCKGITIRGIINLKPIDSNAVVKPYCSHAFGQVLAKNPTPPLDGCLQSGAVGRNLKSPAGNLTNGSRASRFFGNF